MYRDIESAKPKRPKAQIETIESQTLLAYPQLPFSFVDVPVEGSPNYVSKMAGPCVWIKKHNLTVIKRSIQPVIDLLKNAHTLALSVPNIDLTANMIQTTPYFNGADWVNSFISIAPLTPSKKVPKYPVIAHLEFDPQPWSMDFSDDQRAELHYLPDGTIGKGWFIKFSAKDHGAWLINFSTYKGQLSIQRIDRVSGVGKTPLYIREK